MGAGFFADVCLYEIVRGRLDADAARHNVRPVHDRQHPHDFISELAATYSYKFDDKNSFFVYAGLPGEPALGPPTFMHRVSGMNNPDAPLSHHWQDATHITYGVVTAGYVY